MDRDKNSADNLQERMNILIAEIMTAFRDLVNHAAAPVDNTASTGQTGYSSMALEIMMSGIIKSTEDLLSLTRKIRELWLIGPLKAPGAHDAEVDQAIWQDAAQVFAMFNGLRDDQRQRMVQLAAQAGGGFTYERGEIDGPPPPLQPHPQLPLNETTGLGSDGGSSVQIKVEPQESAAPVPNGQQL
ncbi:hypothetical protein NEMBOFW57_001290 [Staphylotrichum longicolle]|uniref:Uncharacterized protein n=1 Tax=Staphylotrichum longicolle TaxID=669026 RepID=A0AAD4F5R9_9PEZI|nr:hypothetical protein NEMBOFW57_001290 [Staphylotrichum longicolle]